MKKTTPYKRERGRQGDIVVIFCFQILRNFSIKTFFCNIFSTDYLERQSPGGAEEGAAEGTLTRKHEWESTTKKATNRSWDKVCFHQTTFKNKKKLLKNISLQKVFCVARAGRFSFFKDHKTAKSLPEQTFRGEPSLDLLGGSVEVASDYTKKKHVFRIK